MKICGGEGRGLVGHSGHDARNRLYLEFLWFVFKNSFYFRKHCFTFCSNKIILIYSNGRYSCTFSNTAATSGNFLRNAGVFSFVELFDSIIERIAKIEP